MLDQANQQRSQEGAEEYILKPIDFRPSVLELLADSGFTPDDIPPAGMRLLLSFDLENRGDWVYSEWLERTHPSLLQMAVAIARTVALSNVGVDIISTDITCSLHRGVTKVIELNVIQTLNPRWAATFVARLLPPDQPNHIPVRVVVCASEADWPGPPWIERALQACPGYGLAVPHRLRHRFDHESLSSDCNLIAYEHPRQPLMNRSLDGLLFLIDWQEFSRSGLPAAQGVVQLELLGSLPAQQADQWRRFVATQPGLSRH